MKLKIALALALFCNSATMSIAFTLDMIGDEGSSLPADPLVMYVPGYGDVRYDTANSSTLSVDSAYPGDENQPPSSLSDHERDALRLTFQAAQPLKFDSVGTSLVDSFIVQPALFEAQSDLVSNQSSGTGGGRHFIDWNKVPEPASALLGAISDALLVLRHRR